MTYSPSTHLVNQLRDAVRVEADDKIRGDMADTAVNLHVALQNFATVPTGEFLAVVNSEWGRAIRLLGTTRPFR